MISQSILELLGPRLGTAFLLICFLGGCAMMIGFVLAVARISYGGCMRVFRWLGFDRKTTERNLTQ